MENNITSQKASVTTVLVQYAMGRHQSVSTHEVIRRRVYVTKALKEHMRP